MNTRDDLVRGAIAALVVVAAGLACVTPGAIASIGLDGAFRVDLEASETAQLALANLMTLVAISGETWRTSGRVIFTDGAFSSFGVTDERTFGPFQLRSTCVFDPDVGFSHLGSTALFSLLNVQMGNYVFLSHDPALSYDQLTMKWSAGDVSLSGVWRVGLCPLEFRSAQVAGQWYVPSCELFMDVRSAFTCDKGFDYLRVTGRLPRVPFLSNDVIETDLRVTVQFDADRKTFTPSLRMRSRKVNACMTPYVRLVAGGTPLEVEGVELYGWLVECSVDDFVEIQLATSLDPTQNRELTGNADYWAAWKLRGRGEGCCGRDLAWELAVYFEENGDSLFDWGLTDASVEIPLGERLTARFGSEFGTKSPHWMLNAGLELRF